MKMNEKKEYIERGALIDSIENCYYIYNSTDRETVRQAIENAPAADVAPVVHGEWKYYSPTMQECSVCKKHTPRHRYGFCPRCGAKMDGGKEE